MAHGRRSGTVALALVRDCVRHDLRGWLLVLLLTVASTLAALALPWPTKVFVDQVLGDAPRGGVTSVLPGAGSATGLLLWVSAASLLLYFSSSAFDALLALRWVRLGQAAVHRVAAEAFASLQRQSLLFHGRSTVGDLTMRVTEDPWAVHALLDRGFMKPLKASLYAAGMAAVLLTLNFRLALVALLLSPLVGACTVLLRRRVRTAGERTRTAAGQVQAHVHQVLTGVQVVQAFGQESRADERFRELSSAVVQARRRSVVTNQLGLLGTGSLNALAMAAVLWVGGREVLADQLTVGGLLVFVAYLTKMHLSFQEITAAYRAVQMSRAALMRVVELIEVGEGPAAHQALRTLGPVEGWVRLEGVSFGYDSDRPVLREVSLSAPPGSTVAVVGPTGAGKSTLVGLVLRLFDPDEGRVTLDGVDLRDVQLDSVRSQVSLVLQESFLFPVSVADNIRYGRPCASMDDVVAAAKAANAHEFIERLPHGYATVLGERGATLSGGQRQRISIARALAKDAPVLVLDEPTSAVDAQTEALLLQALERLMKGRTTLVIAHRLSTIRNADTILVLDQGRVVQTGTHDQLLTEDGLYARLHAASEPGRLIDLTDVRTRGARTAEVVVPRPASTVGDPL